MTHKAPEAPTRGLREGRPCPGCPCRWRLTAVLSTGQPACRAVPPEGPAATFRLQAMRGMVPGGRRRGPAGDPGGQGLGPPTLLVPHTPGVLLGKGPLRTPSAQSQFYCKQQDRGCSGKLCVGVRKDGDRNQEPCSPQHHTPRGCRDQPPRTRKHKASAGRSPSRCSSLGKLAGSPLWGTGPAGLVGPGSADRARAHFLHTAPSSPLLTTPF